MTDALQIVDMDPAGGGVGHAAGEGIVPTRVHRIMNRTIGVGLDIGQG